MNVLAQYQGSWGWKEVGGGQNKTDKSVETCFVSIGFWPLSQKKDNPSLNYKATEGPLMLCYSAMPK